MTTPAATTPAPAASTPAPAADVKAPAAPAAAPAAETNVAATETKTAAPEKAKLPDPLVTMQSEPAPAEPAKAIEGFELPEGFDPVAGETLKGLAGQLGLDASKAKVLLETYSKAQVASQEKAEADFIAQANAMTAQAAEHPVVKELGGVTKARGLASKALNAFGSPALSEALTASGLAYHPEVLAFVARIGAKLGDDTVAGAASSGASVPSEKAQLKALYNHPTSASMFKE